MASSDWSPAKRRYNRRVIVLSVLYAALLIGAELAIKHAVAPPLTYAVAVLPALPLIGIIAAMGRYLAEESDEYQRSLIIDAVLWATGAVLALSTVWGFLETLAGAPHVPVYFAFVVWFGALGLARLVRKWRDS